MVKLQQSKTTGAYWVTVPKKVVEAKGWKPGIDFDFQIVHDKLIYAK